jgi:hypothetical protein
VLMIDRMLELARKDDGWQLTRGLKLFVVFGLVLLLGAISAVIATINPWMVSVMLLTSFLLSCMCSCIDLNK